MSSTVNVGPDDSPKEPTNPTALHDFLAPSVYCLQTAFVKEVGAAGYSKDSKIYEIENLQDKNPCVIRQKGLDVLCPKDGRKGASYVDCLLGEDNVGEATHMLSYTWGYTVGEIVDTLVD